MWLSLAEVPRGRFRGGLWTFPCETFLFACWILVPRPGIEPRTCAVEAQSPNPWTAREVPEVMLLGIQILLPVFKVKLTMFWRLIK